MIGKEESRKLLSLKEGGRNISKKVFETGEVKGSRGLTYKTDALLVPPP